MGQKLQNGAENVGHIRKCLEIGAETVRAKTKKVSKKRLKRTQRVFNVRTLWILKTFSYGLQFLPHFAENAPAPRSCYACHPSLNLCKTQTRKVRHRNTSLERKHVQNDPFRGKNATIWPFWRAGLLLSKWPIRGTLCFRMTHFGHKVPRIGHSECDNPIYLDR